MESRTNRTVQLNVGGQSYKVVSSADESELARLAEIVNAKVAEVSPKGRAVQPQSVLLAALALAHELEVERSRREGVERRTRDVLRRVLLRIDEAIEVDEDDSESDGDSDVVSPSEPMRVAEADS
ncbi:MAG: cell division protein ZapA [Polyangiaceae bacterium]